MASDFCYEADGEVIVGGEVGATLHLPYSAGGSVIVGYCAPVTLTKHFGVRFAEGSKVYNCDKAAKGVIESVVIKKFLVRYNAYGERVILYVDTLNALWNEDDLCDHATALQTAIAYWEARQRDLEEAIFMASCKPCR